MKAKCSPGNHPHADRPNWQPADTIDAYLRNCREGLETYSDRRAAILMGWSRTQIWRAKLMGALPRDLFERLIESDPVPHPRQLANIARALIDGTIAQETECCPHCGGVLRTRAAWSDSADKIIRDWLRENGEAA